MVLENYAFGNYALIIAQLHLILRYYLSLYLTTNVIVTTTVCDVVLKPLKFILCASDPLR